MAKPFSQMTQLERLVNRNRLQRGLAADWSEAAMATDLENRIMKGLTAAAEARREVGAVAPSLALDGANSAGDIYKMALDRAGVDTSGLVGDAAMRVAWNMFRAGQLKPRIRSYGADADSFAERFPSVARVRKA